MSSPRPITAICIGAGSRGKTYTRYSVEFPELMQVIAVAEPRRFHRPSNRARHDIEAENAVDDWTELANRPKFADAVIITTQDNLHAAPAVAFANLGYHILLEKPMAPTAVECLRIVEAVKKNDVILAVCHVLRYTPYMQKMREIINSGAIGEIVNIQHLEPIGFWHFAHSYVRGKWRRADEGTFMLMAKCCHDVDLIRYLMGQSCNRISSMGSLQVFRPDRKPPKASDRCVTCEVEGDCPYSAKKIYLERAKYGLYGWPVGVIVDGEPSIEEVHRAIETGPYGRCVWDCDNDVLDQQTVNMQFDNGATATLTTVAFSEELCVRKTRIFGTRGELNGDGESRIRHFDFNTGTTVIHEAEAPPNTHLMGHGGADFYLIKSFVEAVANNDRSLVLTGPDETLESHMMVFAAELARLQMRVIPMQELWDTGIEQWERAAVGRKGGKVDWGSLPAASHAASPLAESGAAEMVATGPPLDLPASSAATAAVHSGDVLSTTPTASAVPPTVSGFRNPALAFDSELLDATSAATGYMEPTGHIMAQGMATPAAHIAPSTITSTVLPMGSMGGGGTGVGAVVPDEPMADAEGERTSAGHGSSTPVEGGEGRMDRIHGWGHGTRFRPATGGMGGRGIDRKLRGHGWRSHRTSGGRHIGTGSYGVYSPQFHGVRARRNEGGGSREASPVARRPFTSPFHSAFAGTVSSSAGALGDGRLESQGHSLASFALTPAAVPLTSVQAADPITATHSSAAGPVVLVPDAPEQTQDEEMRG